MALHGPEYQTMPSGGNTAPLPTMHLSLSAHNLRPRLMPQDGVVRAEGLLRLPALQLRLLAGEPGLSRRVAWAHVSELEDPAPWLLQR